VKPALRDLLSISSGMAILLAGPDLASAPFRCKP
jgi:hypothetical protein